MKLKFLGTTSANVNCPTAFATDHGTYVFQGKKVTDPEALATVDARGNGLPDDETLVEIPAELLKFIDQPAADPAPNRA